MSKIKTFRGLLTDDSQERVHLQTIDGTTGYKIIKLDVMPADTAKLQQSVLKIYKVEQTTINDDINFSDQTMIAAAYLTKNDDTKYPIVLESFFDTEIFNQDIYITHKDASTGESINYYLELEQVKLEGTETAIATLKNIKNRS